MARYTVGIDLGTSNTVVAFAATPALAQNYTPFQDMTPNGHTETFGIEGTRAAGALGHRKALFGYSGHVPESLKAGDVIQMLNILENFDLKLGEEGSAKARHLHVEAARRAFRIWFALGWPAFIALTLVFWLMIAKPSLGA